MTDAATLLLLGVGACVWCAIVAIGLFEPGEDAGAGKPDAHQFARSVSAPLHSNDNTQGGQRHHGH